MSHYQTLGVKDDATPIEIKRAYRDKAKQFHPDKGGKQEDFEPVVKAYETLSDPDRRLLYDNTGQDSRKPLDAQVQELLLQLFNQALAVEQDVPIVKTAKERIMEGKAKIPGAIKELKAKRKQLEAKRKRVKSRGPVNMVHMIIDGQLKNIAGQIAELENQLVLGKAALIELRSYREKWKEPEPPKPQYFVVNYR